MRTVGQILKETRQNRFYTLEEVEQATKIRKSLLEALEEDNYKNLPPYTFVQGFIRNYSKFLSLDPEKLLAVFRREFSEKKNPPRILEAWINPLNRHKFQLTPAKLLSGLVLTLLVVFFIYLWVEYRFLTGTPYLELIQPLDKVYIDSETVRVRGKTDPEFKVAINNQQVEVDMAGNFSQEIKIPGSVGTITVSATSKLGKTVRIERTVFLKKD